VKIAVSANGKDLDARIDPRFGRCGYFVIVDTDDMSFEAYDNENTGLAGGAGIQSAQFVVSKGAEVVITGSIGPNALRALSTAGVRLFMGESGTVRKAINDYKTGGLISMRETNMSGRYSIGGGAQVSSGMRRGMGRGRGMRGRMGVSR
jgi:predicted Fe-Mo cluster-binding NifX family protein